MTRSRWQNLNPQMLIAVAILAAVIIAPLACGGGDDTLIIYSGRSETLVNLLLQDFKEASGMDVRVKYAGSASIAATVLEEGKNTPADVVFLQDPGSLGSLSDAGMFSELPQDLLDNVDPAFRSPVGHWVGTSGRARTVVYNTSTVDPNTGLPNSIRDFTEPEWHGRVGWAPTNGSFQAFVTAFRVKWGEDAARAWLEGIRANEPREYPNNTSIVKAVARGEVDVGFVNHYYLQRFLEEEGTGFGARNHFLVQGPRSTGASGWGWDHRGKR